MASSGKRQLSDKNASLTAQQDGAVTRSSKTSNVEGTYPSGKSWQANGGPLSGIGALASGTDPAKAAHIFCLPQSKEHCSIVKFTV